MILLSTHLFSHWSIHLKHLCNISLDQLQLAFKNNADCSNPHIVLQFIIYFLNASLCRLINVLIVVLTTVYEKEVLLKFLTTGTC